MNRRLSTAKAMNRIAAIDTRYRGYRFRSRLEARWAVFFDQCCERYIYEHEGYRLPSGLYLPDFFFPMRRAFVEIKPLNQLPTRNFEFNSIGGYRPIDDVFPHELILMWELSRALNLEPGHAVVIYGDPVDVIHGDGGSVCANHSCGGLVRDIGFIDLFHASLFDAADAARAARFERGA